MTKKEVELLTRVGLKGQIVLRKEIRKALGIKKGSMVRTRLVDKKVIIEPFDWNKELEEINRIAKEVAKRWPKGVTAVQAIREDRE